MKPYLLIIIVLFTGLWTGCEQPAASPIKPVRHNTRLHLKADTVVKIRIHDTITVAAVGDLMPGSDYPDSSKLPPDSAKESFTAVKRYFKGSDIVFGNLEGALLDTGMPAAYKKKLEAAYLFRMPTYYGQVFRNAGFNLVSLANNHITDFGENGCTSTMKTLDASGIKYAGLETRPDTVFASDGIKYGFCSFSPNAHTVPLLETSGAVRRIKHLKERCDVVIVSFHGGAEGAAYEHVPFKMESYLGAKRGDVHLFAHTAIDAGADLVLGNGPHVSRALEKYKGRLIAYSLGNFCTYKSVSVAGVCGMAPLLKVKLNKKGEFISGNIIAFRQTHEKGLVRDTLNKAVKRIKFLTETDFPGSGLEIGDDGTILSGQQK